MQTLINVRTRLAACKRTGKWREVADRAQCHYFTVAKLARGAATNPSLKLIEGITAALDEVAPETAMAVSS